MFPHRHPRHTIASHWLAAALAAVGLLAGGQILMRSLAVGDDAVPPADRAAAWKTVEKALEEGKPKTALQALAGVEASAVQDKAWAEAARAIGPVTTPSG
jgi:hypothetical protein